MCRMLGFEAQPNLPLSPPTVLLHSLHYSLSLQVTGGRGVGSHGAGYTLRGTKPPCPAFKQSHFVCSPRPPKVTAPAAALRLHGPSHLPRRGRPTPLPSGAWSQTPSESP